MIDKIATYCTALLLNSRCNQYPFHNLIHTRDVVENVKIISKAQGLPKNKSEIIQIAGWFHDTGFSMTYKGHEDASKKIATQFLKGHNFNQETVDEICNLIEATKMTQNPKNDYEDILCDADLLHLSTPFFFYRKQLLRREWEVFCDLKISDLEWYKTNIEFLKSHHYKSDYGKKVLELRKGENIEKIHEILKYYH